MTTITVLTTVKLQLLLPLVVVLLVAQVSTSPGQEFQQLLNKHSSKVESNLTNDIKIEHFHQEVVEANEVKIARIQRKNGHDVVVQKADEHYTKRILAVVAKTFRRYIDSKLHFYRLKKILWIGGIEETIIQEDIPKFYALLVKYKLIPHFAYSSMDEIVWMCDEGPVMHRYFQSVRKSQNVHAIVDLYTEKYKNNLEKVKDQLANYIVPFVEGFFWDYDGAIDYITTQYKEHCIEGVVQQFASYYIKVWWSSVTRITNAKFDPNDWTLWNEFMATACPFPQYSPFDPNTLKPASKKKIEQFPFDGGAALLDLVDFEQEIAVPERVENLRLHLAMINNSFENSDLIGELVANFSEYKLLSEVDRNSHNENLWIGYQKKLVVLLTIVRMVHEESEKAENYLQGPKEEFIKWHSHWLTVDGPIPNVIVRLVDRALHRSEYFNNQVYTLALQKLVILTNVLTFLFDKTDAQFKSPNEESETFLTNFKAIEDVAIPEEIKMCYTSSRNQMMIKYSEVMDRVVAHFSRMSLLDKGNREFQLEAWALLVLTIVPDFEKIPKESIQVISEVKPEEVTNKSCCGKALNWVSENKCLTGVIVAFIIGIPSIIAISLMGSESQTTATEETLPSTWPTKSTTTSDQAFPIKLVWFVVGAMIVAAIIVWVCGMIRKKRESSSSKASKTNGARKNKKGRQTSATPTGYKRGTPTSTINGTPTGSSTKATPTSTPTTVSRNKPSTSPFLQAWLGQSLTPSSKPTTKPPPISTSSPGPVSQLKVAPPPPSKVSKNSQSQVPKSKAPLGKTKSPKDTTTTKPGEPGKGDQKKKK